MASPFATYIEERITQTQLPAMPFFRNVEAAELWTIASGGILPPRYSKDFKEPLVFLFYGRPAYKIGFEEGSRSDQFWCPVSFIIKPECILDIKRIYPFDSGGFERFYRSHIPNCLDRERFLLNTSQEISRKLIQLFFGSNNNYLLGKSDFKETVEFRHSEVKAYLNILNSTGKTPFDDRAYTIEYQIVSEIKLNECIMAVAAPSEAFDDHQIYDLVVGQWKAFPLEYQTFSGGSSEIYHGAMFGQVIAFLKHRKYI